MSGRQEYQRNWRSRSPEKVLEYNRRYRAKHLELSLWRDAKRRALKHGLDFSIEVDDISIPTQCPVLGTLFEPLTMYSASLDRIDSSGGYVPGNVQVISRKANAMKNDATAEELKAFATWVMNG